MRNVEGWGSLDYVFYQRVVSVVDLGPIQAARVLPWLNLDVSKLWSRTEERVYRFEFILRSDELFAEDTYSKSRCSYRENGFYFYQTGFVGGFATYKTIKPAVYEPDVMQYCQFTDVSESRLRSEVHYAISQMSRKYSAEISYGTVFSSSLYFALCLPEHEQILHPTPFVTRLARDLSDWLNGKQPTTVE